MNRTEHEAPRRAGVATGLARLGMMAALVGALMAPQAVLAQVQADDIPQFVGNWNLPFEVQGQSFAISLSISVDADGAARANVATEVGDQPIETITLNGESLRLEYTQSQIVPAVLTLTPDGENLAVEVEMDFPDGMFVVSTTATRTE